MLKNPVIIYTRYLFPAFFSLIIAHAFFLTHVLAATSTCCICTTYNNVQTPKQIPANGNCSSLNTGEKDYKTTCTKKTDPSCSTLPSTTTSSTSDPSPAAICQQLDNSDARTKCENCIGTTSNKPTGFWTAIGCISTAPDKAVEEIFNLALGLGGIFILVQILLGAFGLITSSGNPSAIQKAKSRIIDSAIALLFVVFSVTIVQLIGIDIFQLPGMVKDTTTTTTQQQN